MSERLLVCVQRKGSDDYEPAQDFAAHPFALKRIFGDSIWSFLGLWPVKLVNTWTQEEIVVRVIDRVDMDGQIQYVAVEV